MRGCTRFRAAIIRRRERISVENNLTSKLPLREHLKNMKRILQVVAEMDKYYFFLTSIVHLINVIIPYIGLYLSAYVLDGIVGGTSLRQMLIVIAVALGASFVLSCIASTIWNRMEVRRDDMYYRYSSAVELKILTMDYSRVDSPEVAKLRDRIQRDMNWGAGLNSVFWQFNGILYTCINIVMSTFVGLPILVQLFDGGNRDVLLVLVLLILLAVVALKVRVHFRKMSERYMEYDLKEEDKEELFCHCWPLAQGGGFNYKNGKDIRIYGGYDMLKRWSTDVLYHKKFRKQQWEGAIGFAGEAGISGMLYGVVEGAAYLMVVMIALAGGITAGNVLRFAGTLHKLMSELVNLCGAMTNFAMTARRHVSTLQFLEIEDEMYKGKLPLEKRSDNQYQIEFRNVSFRYPGSEQYALKNFSIKLNIGEKLAIVGRNGSGKTTMIKLLCRLYDPEEGEILLNGVDIRKFKQVEYSQLFSVVFQDYQLLPFLLAENVATDTEYDAKKVQQCLCDAGFGERLDNLSDGIQTYLNKDYDDSGVEISGGEAQKIAIARSVYKDAPFVLLDEPTAALDPIAEYEIYTNFDRIIRDKTAIYISHRLSSCRFCEKIAVFDHGTLVQCGTHEELVADKNSVYYEMWNAQAQYYQ